jgi:hypothetical protein
MTSKKIQIPNKMAMAMAGMSLIPFKKAKSEKAKAIIDGMKVVNSKEAGSFVVYKIVGDYALLSRVGATKEEENWLITALEDLEPDEEASAKEQVGVLPDGSPVYDDGGELVDENGDPVDEEEVSYAKKTAGQTKKSVASASSLFFKCRGAK